MDALEALDGGWSGSVALDPSGNIYIGGYYHSGSLDLDPSAGVDPHPPIRDADSFLVKLVCDNPPNDLDGDGIPNDVDNCPVDSKVNQDDFDLDGIGDVCDGDFDGDGVPNDDGLCDQTPLGIRVDSTGVALIDMNNDCLIEIEDVDAFVERLLNS